MWDQCDNVMNIENVCAMCKVKSSFFRLLDDEMAAVKVRMSKRLGCRMRLFQRRVTATARTSIKNVMIGTNESESEEKHNRQREQELISERT